jgi:hypothetical protein
MSITSTPSRAFRSALVPLRSASDLHARLLFEPLEDRRLLDSLHGSWHWGERDIPDNGMPDHWAVWEGQLGGAPSDAVITDVDVEYFIEHPYVGDLEVWLTTQHNGQWYNHTLWNRQGNGDDDIHESKHGLDDWDGLPANRTWYLCAGDWAAMDVGHIEWWEVWVHYETQSIEITDADVDVTYDLDGDGYGSKFDVGWRSETNFGTMPVTAEVWADSWEIGISPRLAAPTKSYTVTTSNNWTWIEDVSTSHGDLDHRTWDFWIILKSGGTEVGRIDAGDDSDLNDVKLELPSEETQSIEITDADVDVTYDLDGDGYGSKFDVGWRSETNFGTMPVTAEVWADSWEIGISPRLAAPTKSYTVTTSNNWTWIEDVSTSHGDLDHRTWDFWIILKSGGTEVGRIDAGDDSDLNDVKLELPSEETQSIEITDADVDVTYDLDGDGYGSKFDVGWRSETNFGTMPVTAEVWADSWEIGISPRLAAPTKSYTVTTSNNWTWIEDVSTSHGDLDHRTWDFWIILKSGGTEVGRIDAGDDSDLNDVKLELPSEETQSIEITDADVDVTYDLDGDGYGSKFDVGWRSETNFGTMPVTAEVWADSWEIGISPRLAAPTKSYTVTTSNNWTWIEDVSTSHGDLDHRTWDFWIILKSGGTEVGRIDAGDDSDLNDVKLELPSEETQSIEITDADVDVTYDLDGDGYGSKFDVGWRSETNFGTMPVTAEVWADSWEIGISPRLAAPTKSYTVTTSNNWTWIEDVSTSHGDLDHRTWDFWIILKSGGTEVGRIDAGDDSDLNDVKLELPSEETQSIEITDADVDVTYDLDGDGYGSKFDVGWRSETNFGTMPVTAEVWADSWEIGISPRLAAPTKSYTVTTSNNWTWIEDVSTSHGDLDHRTWDFWIILKSGGTEVGRIDAGDDSDLNDVKLELPLEDGLAISSATVPDDLTRVDNDSDGYCQSFEVNFSVTSAFDGSIYYEIIEYDGYLVDDSLLLGTSTPIAAGETLIFSPAISVGNYDDLPGDDIDGQIEIRIDVFDATSGERVVSVTPADFVGLGGILVENPEDDSVPLLRALLDFESPAGQIIERFLDYLVPGPVDMLLNIVESDGLARFVEGETARHISLGGYVGADGGLISAKAFASLTAGYTFTYYVGSGDWRISQGITLSLEMLGGFFPGQVAEIGAGIETKAYAEQYLTLDRDLAGATPITAGFGLGGEVISGFDAKYGASIPLAPVFGGVVSADLWREFDGDVGVAYGFALERDMSAATFVDEVGEPGVTGSVLASMTPYGDGWAEYILTAVGRQLGPMGSVAIDLIRGEPIPMRLVANAALLDAQSDRAIRVLANEQLVGGATMSISAGLGFELPVASIGTGLIASYSESFALTTAEWQYNTEWDAHEMRPGDGQGDDHGDTRHAATDLRDVVNPYVRGRLDPIGDADWFRITADQDHSYWYYASPLEGLTEAPIIRLYTPSGVLLAESQLTPGNRQLLQWTPGNYGLTTGDFIIEVRDQHDDEVGDYELELFNYDKHPDENGGSAAPTIGSFCAIPPDVSEADSFALEASGVEDDEGDEIHVQMYVDSNGNGYWDADGDAELDGIVQTGPDTWSIQSLAASGFGVGEHRLFAVAIDEHGEMSVETTQVTVTQSSNDPPDIAHASADPNPVRPGQLLTLVASNVTDSDGTVGVVAFYFDEDNDGIPESGEEIGYADSFGQSEWRLIDLDTAELAPGTYTFLAVARDDDQAWSDPSPLEVLVTDVPNQPPAIGAVAVEPAAIGRGDDLLLTATGVSDPDGTVAQVKFYWDSDGSGGFTPEDEELTDNDAATPDGNGGWDFAVFGAKTVGFPVATITIYAIALDDSGDASNVVSAPVDVVNNPPIVDAVVVDELMNGSLLVTGPVTARGVGVVDLDDGIEDVFLVIDADGDPQSYDTLLWDREQIGEEWIWTGEAGAMSDWLHTSIRFGVYAVDLLGAPSEVRWTDEIWINEAPTLGGISASAPVVEPGDTVRLVASDAADADPGLVESVVFYRRLSDGSFEWIGDGSLNVDDDTYYLDYPFDSLADPRTVTFSAQATDDWGAGSPLGDVTTDVRVNAPPSIDALEPTGGTYFEPGQLLTLTASSVQDDGDGIEGATFYIDGEADGIPQLDEPLDPTLVQQDGNDYVWSDVVPASWSTHTWEFWAVATDGRGVSGDAVGSDSVRVNTPPTLTSIEASRDVYRPDQDIELTAHGVSDELDGLVDRVEFYRRLDGSDYELIGELTGHGGSEYVLVRDIDPAWGTGPQTFVAVAIDSDDALSHDPDAAPRANVTVNTPPTVDAVTAPNPVVGPGGRLTLQLGAHHDDDPDDSVQYIRIYLDGIRMSQQHVDDWADSWDVPSQATTGLYALTVTVVDSYEGESDHVALDSQFLIGHSLESGQSIPVEGGKLKVTAGGGGSKPAIWYAMHDDGPAIFVHNSNHKTNIRLKSGKEGGSSPTLAITGLSPTPGSSNPSLVAKHVVLKKVDVVGGEVRIAGAKRVKLGDMTGGASLVGGDEIGHIRLGDVSNGGTFELGKVTTLRAGALQLSDGLDAEKIKRIVVKGRLDADITLTDDEQDPLKLTVRNPDNSNAEGSYLGLSAIDHDVKKISVNTDCELVVDVDSVKRLNVDGDMIGTIRLGGYVPKTEGVSAKSINITGTMLDGARLDAAGSVTTVKLGHLEGGTITAGNADWQQNSAPDFFDQTEWLISAGISSLSITGETVRGMVMAPNLGDVRLETLAVGLDSVVSLYANTLDRLRAEDPDLDWKNGDAFDEDDEIDGLVCEYVPVA